MPIQSIEPRRLYRQIAEQLRQLIGQGEYAVGARLPAERDLARQLGVSRPTVREALIALEVEGWVEVRTGSGVYVQDRQNAKPSPGEMTPATGTADRPDTTPDTTPEATPEWGPLELIRARRVVEGEIAALAASQAKRADIARMTAAIKAMQRDADAGTLPLDGDRDFHTAVVNACGNAVLTETVQNFWDSRRGPLFTRLGDYFENAESWRAAIAEHQAVLNAIRARDAPAARAAMQLHMDNSHARFSVSWRQVKAA